MAEHTAGGRGRRPGRDDGACRLSRSSTLSASTARSMPSSATTGPKCLTSPSARIAGSAMAVGTGSGPRVPDELGDSADFHAAAQPEGGTSIS